MSDTPENLVMKRQKFWHKYDELFENAFEDQSFNFCWRHTLNIPKTGIRSTLHSIYRSKYSRDPSTQLINHFPNIDCMTTKSGIVE